MIATHPTDHELGDFLLGKLGDRGEAAVEGHLVECDSCRERAAELRADDTFTELLASARTRFDSILASAPTPTLDGAATPPAFAPTLAWDGTPGATTSAVAVPEPLANHPKYRPIRRLGIGGMGTVWLAEHKVMNRPVAVKVIRPDLLARPGATERFLREVRAAAKLHHPNIVTAFDADPAGDSCLFVMEYVPGETLADRLAAGPLPLVEALKVIREAARGLAHAHAHGLVHRDVKPHNLMHAADGSTKVLDFGLAGVGAGEVIAADGEGLTGAGMVVGTPDYIAPEQIADPHTADARADVYGLGCTLYHLLAGRPPMPDGSVLEKLTAQRTRPMDPIPGLPAAVATVLAKMTAKDPAERYQTADEVVAALERCIRMVDPVMRKRRRLIAISAAISLTLFLMISAVMYKLLRDNEVIEIKTNDPDVEVVIKRKGDVVKIIDHKSHKEWTYDTLKNEIGDADTPDGLKLQVPDNQAIVLKRNGKEVFTVTRIPRAAAPAAETTTAGPRLVRTIDHRHPVRDIAWTPDGQSVVAVGSGLCRYDVAAGSSVFESRYEMLTVPGHKEKLNADGPTQMAVTDDGGTAVIVYGNTLGRFSLADGKAFGFQPLPFPADKSPVTALAVSPDGRTVVVATAEALVFDEPEKAGVPRVLKVDRPGPVVGLRYSPDGRHLVAAAVQPDGSKTELIVLDAKTHEVVGRRTLDGMLGRLDISRDGKRLVAAGGIGTKGGFRVLTLPDLTVLLKEAELAGFVEAVWLSADGKQLTLERAPAGFVDVWDIDQERRLSDGYLRAHTEAKAGDAPVRHVAFSPDGRRVAVARGNEIGVWELSAGPAAASPAPAKYPGPQAPRLVQTIPGRVELFRNLAFVPGGQALLVAEQGYLKVFDPVTGKQLFSDDLQWAGPMSLAVSEDGRTAALGGNKVFLYDLVARKRVAEIPGRTDGNNAVLVTSVSLTPDGRTLAYVVGREAVYYDRTKGELKRTRPADDGARTVAVRYSPDGRYLVDAVQLEPENKARISIRDAKTHEVLAHRDLPGLLAWRIDLSADGKRLFVASSSPDRDRVLVILSIPSGEVLKQVKAMSGPGLLVPSPDGRRLATVGVPLGGDGEVVISDLESERPLFAWAPSPKVGPESDPRVGKGRPVGTSVTFSPDGHTLATARGNQIRIWSLDPAPAADAADRAAAEYVLSIGGTVRVNDQDRELKTKADLPKEPFRLTSVILTDNRKVTDAGLAVFKDCTNLTLLYLGKTAVTDAGLANFKGCWNLNDLELEDTQVTDAGLAHFKNCPALRHLDLDGCPNVTDAGLAHFKNCKKLRDVYLFDTGVTDDGMALFADCASLEIVGFGETRVGDAGLTHLKDCKRVTQLTMNSAQVTDRGLEVVAGYKDLKVLSLQATKVTDAGVKRLAGLGKLEFLDLKATQVTAAGVAELRKALPKCRIEWDQ